MEMDASLYGWRRVTIDEPVGSLAAGYYHNLAIGKRTGRVYRSRVVRAWGGYVWCVRACSKL